MAAAAPPLWSRMVIRRCRPLTRVAEDSDRYFHFKTETVNCMPLKHHHSNWEIKAEVSVCVCVCEVGK